MSSDVPLPMPHGILTRLVIFLASVGLVGFFALCETAFLAMDRLAVDKLSGEGHRQARKLRGLAEDSSTTVSAILVGTNVFTVIASASAASLAFGLGFGSLVSGGLVPAFTTAVLFVLSELVPKTYAAQRPTEMALWVAGALTASVRILRPVSVVLAVIPTCFTGLLKKRAGRISVQTDEAVRVAAGVAGQNGYVNPDETHVILGVLDSSDKVVSQVMVPLAKAAVHSPEATLGEAARAFTDRPFSRVPVVEPKTGSVLGIVYIKDVMNRLLAPGGSEQESVMTVARKPYYARSDQNLLDLLAFMRKVNVHMVVVLEEGSAAGIVTMEDLLEEILGAPAAATSCSLARGGGAVHTGAAAAAK